MKISILYRGIVVDLENADKKKVIIMRLFAELEEGEQSARENGWLKPEQVDAALEI